MIKVQTKENRTLIMIFPAKNLYQLLSACSILITTGISVSAQSITPNNDGTGTVVNTNGQTTEITGGSLSGDGQNLFHSFGQFGLSAEEIANFRSDPDIQNILSRINGGDPSIINGLIQVLEGNSNLLLMNPAGIIFGAEAQLNIPADFTATTATGIGFGNNLWFNAVGENNYQSLVGTPSEFAFDAANPGAIINNGELSLAEGSNLTFLGGNVINTGGITAPQGSVTLSAVPGSSKVRVSQPGHLLSLDIEPPRDNEGNILPFAAKDLPSLLTSNSESADTGLTSNQDGSITIDEAGTSFQLEPDMAIASGTIDVSGNFGGEVNVLGNNVGLLSSDIDASGKNAGGDIRIGGDYQGNGTVPNASNTIVDNSSSIDVSATESGNGGQAIVWSDSLTRFTGQASARGGTNGGDGGLVEISGKESLVFTGTVDASSPLGQAGELLLDPRNITIADTGSGFNNPFEFGDSPGEDFTIAADSITNITNNGTDVTLQANNNITVAPTGAIITNNPNGDGGNITFQAGRGIEINADITTDNGDLTLSGNEVAQDSANREFADFRDSDILVAEGVTLDLGNGNFQATTSGISENIIVNNIQANNITLTANEIDLNGGENSVSGQNILLQDDGSFGRINIGTTEDDPIALDLTTNDIAALTDGFEQITISPGTSRGSVTLFDSVANGGETPFQDPVRLLSGGSAPSSLTGTNLDTTWTIENQTTDFPGFVSNFGVGNLNDTFANGLVFENFRTLNGGSGNDTFVHNGETLNVLNGGGGNNTLFSTNALTNVNIDTIIVFGENSGESPRFRNIQNIQGGGGDQTFFIFNNSSISGNLDGGGGNDRLFYQSTIEEDVSVDLEAGTATGVGGTVTNINEVFFPANSNFENIENFPDRPDADNTITDNPPPVEFNPDDTSAETLPPEIADENLPENNPVDIPINFSPETIRGEDSNRGNNRNNSAVNIARDDKDDRDDEDIPEINSVAFNRANQRNRSLIQQLDKGFARDYDRYYNRVSSTQQQTEENELGINVNEVQQTLQNIEESTGAKPALVYATFFPAGIDALEGRSSNILPQPDDELELVTISAKGEPIRQRVEGVTRAEVAQSARRFAYRINNIQPKKLFLPQAQQLYKWFIEPIKVDLEKQEINNLVFLMDDGLRTIPMAALHDGKKYLVEEYSIGLMPSISLTDTRYKSIKDVGLLAMGSDTFPADSSLFPLPAVPVEIDIITQKLWSGGSSFMDADFTISNLQKTQKSQPFGILHLATHAEFNPGTPKNSFIQFGDRKLSLDQVRELGLSNPQVELMVLSACKTAFGDRDAEYGFAGLAHQAGVKSALGTLWYVSDQGTLSLMSKFYQGLKTAPIKAEALRQAQVAMINREVRLEGGKLITDSRTFDLPPDIDELDITHPFYWSPFTIIGNPW